jgi:hypothetical protein
LQGVVKVRCAAVAFLENLQRWLLSLNSSTCWIVYFSVKPLKTNDIE